MNKWPGATRKVARYWPAALLILAGVLMLALSVLQGGVR